MVYYNNYMKVHSKAKMDIDLEEAGQDLASWLFKDEFDLKNWSDFPDGAKETYSLPMGSFSPSTITTEDVPEFKGLEWEINWNNLDVFPENEQKNQSLLDDIPWNMDVASLDVCQTPIQWQVNEPVQNETEANMSIDICGNEIDYDSGSSIGHCTPKSFCHSPSGELMQEAFNNNDEASESIIPVSSSTLAVPETSKIWLTEVPYTSTPQIITVPISEIFKVEPTIKREPSVEKTYDLPKIPSQPVRKVFKMKRLNAPSKSVPIAMKEISQPIPSSPVLKDVISSIGDDVLYELVNNEQGTTDFLETMEETEMNDEQMESIQLHLSPDSPAESFALEVTDQEEFSPKMKRQRPYSKEERKLRKKEQNKRAAIKYRQKKKEEEGTTVGSLQQEEEINKTLKEEVKSLETEVNFMRKLVQEILESKKRI